MTKSNAATNRRAAGAFQEIQESGEDDREVVHLLRVPPPAGGGTCTCDVCGLVFQSRATTWINNATQHHDDHYHGKYKSCRPLR